MFSAQDLHLSLLFSSGRINHDPSLKGPTNTASKLLIYLSVVTREGVGLHPPPTFTVKIYFNQ